MLKIQAKLNLKNSPWTEAAWSLAKKSAGLGGGVFEKLGDFGSKSITISVKDFWS